jgi:hypothetical protein
METFGTQRLPGLRRYDLRNLELVAKVHVLDRHYSEAFGFPAPPLNFIAGVKFEF